MKKKTICHLFLERVKRSGSHDAIASIENGKLQFTSFDGYKNIVEAITIGLFNIDLKSKSKVCILSHTRKDWHFLDMGILCAGAISVPIYPSYTAEEVEYIIKHSEAEFLIVEDNKQFEKLVEIANSLTKIKRIIAIEPIKQDLIEKLNFDKTIITYEEFVQMGIEELHTHPDKFEFSIDSIKEDEMATIVYTSGTTGNPKGAIITHKALCQVLLNIKKFSLNAFDNNDRLLTFLPLSHVLGRCESFFPIVFGCQSVYAESINKIISNISIAKPTLMVAVPRIFEKIYEKTMSTLEDNLLKKSLFDWAMKSANEYFHFIDHDKTPPTKVIIEYQLAKKLVLKKVYEQFGGRIRYFISGGAPLSPQINHFLRNTNLTVLEGYGLTETVAPCFVNPLNKQIAGTVGIPIGDVEVKFMDDGEILIKSVAMFSGYYKDEEETKAALDDEGWFHTGDIGRINDEGFLQITDRKKDIIITSGGKNIAPQKIENELKLSPLIAQAVIIGDQKKYLTALVGIEKQAFEGYLDEFEIDNSCNIEYLSTHKDIVSLVAAEISKANEELASFETIKDFKILPIELNQSNFLTPSLKIKRKLVQKEFITLVDAMYAK